jgi:SAM-dependent methyltransferase
VSEAASGREYGVQFDRVAQAYDSHRPTYPEELVDAACAAAGVHAGDRVLEIGCGTGQLTAALAARGLRVLAVDPGARMIERARVRVGPAGAEFVCGRFEDVALPDYRFAAVFSATAFHWVDPAVSWSKVASLLDDGGTLVLLTHGGGADPDSIAIERELFDRIEAIAPEIAATLPRPRLASALLEGVECRRGNVSALWSWVSQHDELEVPEAAELFDDVQLRSRTVWFEWTAEQLNAHMRTTSLSFRLGPQRTAALEADTHRVLGGYGGRIRLPELAVAVTARKLSPAA